MSTTTRDSIEPEIEAPRILVGDEVYEMYGELSAYFIGQQSTPMDGGILMKLGVLRESRAAVLDVMDTTGEVLHWIAFRRVPSDDVIYESNMDADGG